MENREKEKREIAVETEMSERIWKREGGKAIENMLQIPGSKTKIRHIKTKRETILDRERK